MSSLYWLSRTNSHFRPVDWTTTTNICIMKGFSIGGYDECNQGLVGQRGGKMEEQKIMKLRIIKKKISFLSHVFGQEDGKVKKLKTYLFGSEEK